MFLKTVPRPERSYSAIVSVLSIWVLVVVVIGVDLSKRPYLGAKFAADITGTALVVTAVSEATAAFDAGLTVGTRITHAATDDVVKYALTGFEAVVGRHQLHNYAMIRDTVAAKHRIWPLLFDPLSNRRIHPCLWPCIAGNDQFRANRITFPRIGLKLPASSRSALA